MPSTMTKPLFEQIDSWIQEIDTVKKASAPTAKTDKKPVPKATSTKKVAAPSGMGESSHPSDDVDDSLQEAETGERFSENEADVKADVPGSAVDETDPHSGGTQDDKQYNIGTNQSSVGEDPAVEDDFKGDKDDPGTDHPANADDVGEKYSTMRLPKLLKLAEDRANGLLADLANSITSTSNHKNTNKKATVQKGTSNTSTVIQEPVSANPEIDKLASMVVEQAIKDAILDADLVGSYLHSYYQAQVKKAEGDASNDQPKHDEPDGDEGGGGPASDGGNAGADMLSALGAGGGGGGAPGAGGPPPDMGGGAGPGGPPPELAGGGGMPPGGPGGDMGGPGGPPGGPGGPGGGPGGEGVSQEQALQELAMALQELGISPEELAQLAQGQGAKMAEAVKGFKRAGKFRFSEAKSAQERQTRDYIKDYIRELTGSK